MKRTIPLLFVCACATDTKTPLPGDPDPVGTGTVFGYGPSADGPDVTPPVVSCPLGAPTFTSVLGPTSPLQALRLAVESDGKVFVAGSAGAIIGETELSAAGAVLTELPIGSLVEIDPVNAVYIAGVITGPVDLGNGIVLNPPGPTATFIIKLDANGEPVFAKLLDDCITGAVSLAVSIDGRIAISGTNATLVLADDGEVLFPRTEAGQVAFDSTGALLIASSQTPTEPAFLAKVDRDGNPVFRNPFNGQGVDFTRLLTDADDNIIFVGETTAFVDLFGVGITAHYSSEAGRVSGAFAVKVTPKLARLFAVDLGIVEANDVAIDPRNHLVIAGAGAVNVGFFRSIILDDLDPTGAVTSFELGNGRAAAVAVDACGAVLAGFVKEAVPVPGSSVEAVVQKLEL